MRVLIATGRCAEDVVKESVGQAADVVVLDIDVAALMTPPLLKKAYSEHIRQLARAYDIILIPGSSNPSGFGSLAEELNTNIVLGPKQAYDLNLVLDSLEDSQLSLNESADRIILKKRQNDALQLLIELERSATYDFKIRDKKIGGNSRMKVLAEIIDAPFVDCKRIAKRHIRNGADIIDVGIPIGTTEKEVRQTFAQVNEVTSRYNVATSVDSLDPALICAGIDAGAELVLSFTAENASEIGPLIAEKDIATVVLPHNGDVCSSVALARGYQIRKILADPVLYPIGVGAANSLVEYRRVRSLSRLPLFLGVGNIVELMEADSVGANALLAGFAMELGVSMLFTPEHSDKARGSVEELKTAAQMMQLVKFKKGSPKDLGINLLKLKERKRRPEYEITRGSVFDTKDFGPKIFSPDPSGSFVIGIKDGIIYARHDSGTTIQGDSAEKILTAILELKLASTAAHAGYLGRELKQAEIALKLGRSYAQDDSF
ncbi:MAG: dihydropteroate synthase-like protein [Halobacteriota archaeon]